jgi:hypothetical protein
MENLAKSLFGQQPAGQPGNASQPVTQGSEPAAASETQAPPDLTTLLREIQEIKSKLPETVKSAIQENNRSQQAARDRQTAEIDKRFKARMAEIQQITGAQATQEQATRLRENVAQEVVAENPSQPSTPAPGQVPTSGAGQSTADWKLRMLDLIQKETGVTLAPADPELQAQQDSDDPVALMTTLRAAATAKKERTQREAQGRSGPLDSSAPAGNPIANITDRDQLWKLARQKRS